MLLYAYISSDINIAIHLSLSIQVMGRGQPSRLLPLCKSVQFHGAAGHFGLPQ